MKKLVLIVLVAAVTPIIASAQGKKSMSQSHKPMAMEMGSPTAKGKWLVGPALSFASSSDDDGTNTSKVSSMTFEPEIGYFMADNLSVGLSLGLSSDQTRVDGTATDKSSGFSVAPTLRYYMPISPKFQFLGKVMVPIGSVKYTLENGNDIDVKSTYFGVQVMPAFAFFPSNKISIDLTWGGLYFVSTKEGTNTNNSFGLDVFNDNEFTGRISGPSLGVKWHLGK